MKKTFKRILSVLLCLLMLAGTAAVASAAQNDDPEAYKASSLHKKAGNSPDAETEYIHDSRFESGYNILDVIDVSYHNGVINWERVYASGIHNVMIRAGYRGYTEGVLQEDENFVSNVKAAQNAGLNVGLYFFSQAVTVTEATEEANYVIDLILLNNLRSYISLPIAFDF